MSKCYFQVAQKGFWKSNFFSGLNIEGIAIGNSACLLVLIWFLPVVLGLGISVYKVTSLQDVRGAASNPVLSLRNE